MRFVLFIIFLLCISVGINAKNTTEAYINAVEFSELNDITARANPLIDMGGEPCALIKVSVTNSDNLKLKGSSIFKEEIIDNSIWLWVLDGTRKIEVSGNNMHPVEINFTDYGYPSLHGKVTYQLNITIGYKSEKEVYKDVIIEKERVKTKYVDKDTFEPMKERWFILYQYQYAFPAGINIGVCNSYGGYVFANYWENYDYKTFTIGAGPMFRLSPHFFLQTGIGLSLDNIDEDETNIFFTAGGSLIFRVKAITIGAGFYYNGISSYYGRSIGLDGIIAQFGFNF